MGAPPNTIIIGEVIDIPKNIKFKVFGNILLIEKRINPRTIVNIRLIFVKILKLAFIP